MSVNMSMNVSINLNASLSLNININVSMSLLRSLSGGRNMNVYANMSIKQECGYEYV